VRLGVRTGLERAIPVSPRAPGRPRPRAHEPRRADHQPARAIRGRQSLPRHRPRVPPTIGFGSCGHDSLRRWQARAMYDTSSVTTSPRRAVDVFLRCKECRSSCLRRPLRTNRQFQVVGDRPGDPPFAVPSSLVAPMPLTPFATDMTRAPREAVLADRGVEHEQDSCGAPPLRARDAADLSARHEVTRVWRRRRVDEQDVPACAPWPPRWHRTRTQPGRARPGADEVTPARVPRPPAARPPQRGTCRPRR